MRRVLSLFASVMLVASAAYSQERILTVGGYGGSFQALMEKTITPQFEKDHNVKIQFVAGDSTENLARLQAQKGNQEIDVVILDDGPMYQADALGFCAPVKESAAMKDIYDLAKIGPNSLGIGFVATGFGYNVDLFKEKGWEPPSSWKDLEDNKYADLLTIPPITNTYGLHALVMTARLNGGGESNIDPGFKEMEDKVAPNVLAFEGSSGKLSELFQSKSLALAVWGSGRVKSLSDTGFPVKFAYPKEGAVALMIATCPVVGSNVPEVAQTFIDYLLRPDVQVKVATAMGAGPVNKKSELPPELAKVLPYGQEQISKLVKVDWDTINKNRVEWTQRWAREIER